MSRQHYKPLYPTETFSFEGLNTIFDESRRSKSKEHTDRFINIKTSQKSEKIEENESYFQ